MDTDTGWTGSHSFTSVRQIDIQTDSLRAREFCVAHQHNCQTTGTRGQGRAGQGGARQGWAVTYSHRGHVQALYPLWL
jgi:hypothetical protein